MGCPPRSWMHPQIPDSPKSQMPNQVPDSLQGSQMLLGAQCLTGYRIFPQAP